MAVDANRRPHAIATCDARQHVIDQQLQAALALVFVDVEAIDELRAAARRVRRIASARLDVIEGDRIEGAPAARDFHPHLHVALADDARGCES